MSQRVLRISEDLTLPALEAQTQTLIVYGGKGMGKTNFGAVLCEELDRAGLRFCYIDPLGVAYGLKHSADGRGPGIPVLIIGGLHGDLPLEPTAGALVADLVVDEDVHVLIDISRRADGRMWSVGERIRFVRDYCYRLFERQGERRRPIMQIIDECGRFAPEQVPKGADDIFDCISSIEQLVEWGRNVGVGVTLITQRSARMRKSVSELAEMMVAFRTVGPRSIDAIVDWFGEHVPRDDQKRLIEQLRQLGVGTALVVSPGWLGVEGAYRMRARETFDSSATPESGKERHPRGQGAQIDRDHYVARMAETVEKAKAEDPRELRRQIAELRRELERRPTETKVETVTETVEVPVLANGALERIEALAQQLSETAGELGNAGAEIHEQLRRLHLPGSAGRPRPSAPPGSPPVPRQPPPAADTPARHIPQRGSGPAADGNLKLGKAHRAILAVLDQRAGLVTSKRQLAVWTGYSIGGGGFNNPLGALRSAGLIEGSDPIAITSAGREAIAGQYEPLPEGPALLEHWARLGKAHGLILRELAAAYPHSISKQELADRTGYEVSGGGFNNPLGKLRTLELIEGSAELRLTDAFGERITGVMA